MLWLLPHLVACHPLTGATPDPEPTPDSAADTAGDSFIFPESREAWLWPFLSESPWNVSVGSELTLAEANDPCSWGTRNDSVSAWINAKEWSHPMYRATDADPVVEVWEDDELEATFALPPDAIPSLPEYPDGDAHMHVVDPSGRTVHEMWKVRGEAPQLEVESVDAIDLYGTGVGGGGVRIYGGSAIAGLIRKGELEAGIFHGLALSLPLHELEPRAVWPASDVETSAEDEMIGVVPVGQLVVLPPDVPESLATSAAGLAVLRALRDYGAYVVDHAANFALYAEPTLEQDIDPARDDLDAIRDRLRCATNNTENNPGGPGERANPPAPALD